MCDICLCWSHAKCINLSRAEIVHLSCSDEHWFCCSCIQSTFPYNNIDDDEEFLLTATSCSPHALLSLALFLIMKKSFY